MGHDDNGSVMLKKSWLVIIIVAAIGSPFAAFATYRERVNTLQEVVKRQQVKVENNTTALAEINGKLDVILKKLTVSNNGNHSNIE